MEIRGRTISYASYKVKNRNNLEAKLIEEIIKLEIHEVNVIRAGKNEREFNNIKETI